MMLSRAINHLYITSSTSLSPIYTDSSVASRRICLPDNSHDYLPRRLATTGYSYTVAVNVLARDALALCSGDGRFAKQANDSIRFDSLQRVLEL